MKLSKQQIRMMLVAIADEVSTDLSRAYKVKVERVARWREGVNDPISIKVDWPDFDTQAKKLLFDEGTYTVKWDTQYRTAEAVVVFHKGKVKRLKDQLIKDSGLRALETKVKKINQAFEFQLPFELTFADSLKAAQNMIEKTVSRLIS